MTVQPAHKKTTQPVLEALRGRRSPSVPFWLMRQAGRYLPEYRALREKAGSFLNLCFHPEHAAEITLQPVRRFDMDAAILFSDILVIPYALGQQLEFVEGEGPRLGPLDIPSLYYTATKLDPVLDALRHVRPRLAPEKTLIGFAGAPWTVACYMVDGQGGGTFEKTKALARSNPAAFTVLIDRLVDATARYLVAQIRAGADTVQIFDSWAGLLPDTEFTRWVIEPTAEIRRRLQDECPGVPVIGFPRKAGSRAVEYAHSTKVDGLGLDQDADMRATAILTGDQVCLQGNLAPEALLAGGTSLETAARNILSKMHGLPFIFNLGHGVIKETPPEHVAALARIIREHRG